MAFFNRSGQSYQYVEEYASQYKKGINMQRELFKAAKHENDYDSMCDAVENIMSDIKPKLLKKGKKKVVQRVELITDWYRTKEAGFTKNTPEGRRVVFPADMYVRVNKNLTIAYELLIGELEGLELL